MVLLVMSSLNGRSTRRSPACT